MKPSAPPFSDDDLILYPLMRFPDEIKQIEHINGEDLPALAEFVAAGNWGYGGYLDKRENMYLAPHFHGIRNIHMGIDIWAPAGKEVFSPLPGEVAYLAFRNYSGDYGGTVIIKHRIRSAFFFALYGHLSKKTVTNLKKGQLVHAGDLIGQIGNEKENGSWPPHLHLQVSTEDPGTADMPGVVSEQELRESRIRFPDPGFLMGNIQGI